MSLSTYPFYVHVDVRFRDLDALGHVNNAVYFTYMEIARNAFFAEVMGITSPSGLRVIVGEASCRFVSAATYRERLRIGIGAGRWGNKSFDFVYGMEGEDVRPVATGRTVMVMYDYQAGRSFPIPEAFRQQILDFQGTWQPPA